MNRIGGPANYTGCGRSAVWIRMNAIVILNPAAGAIKNAPTGLDREELRRAFASEGISAEIQVADATHLTESIAAALARRPDAMIVGGGDGTISTAAGCLAGQDIPLGVLPLGTLNHFARDLGLPPVWRDAVAALAHGERRTVDLGEVNGRIFINNCSIGSYAEAVRRRDALRRTHGIRKWWAMVLATVAVFRHLRRVRLRLETIGHEQALRTPFVVVANNRYSGRVLDYSLRPQLAEGRLWIYTTREGRRLQLLHLVIQSLIRKIDRIDNVDTLAVTKATLVRVSRAALVAIDGEPVEINWPLHFLSRPAALHVLAPRERSNGA
jgi:diacylglycerol kinase family enzyme